MKVYIEAARETLHEMVTEPDYVIPSGLFGLFLVGYIWIGHPLRGVADFVLGQAVAWLCWSGIPRWVDRRVEEETGQKR